MQEDLFAAETVRDRAIHLVAQNRPAWMQLAMPSAIRWVRIKPKGYEFTSEMLRRCLPVTDEPRVMGNIMKGLAKSRLIEATDIHRPSGLTTNHNRPMRVWRVR